MTTPIKDLITDLQELANEIEISYRIEAIEEAVKALQSQAGRIKELEEQHHSAMQAAEKEIEHYRLKSAAQPLPFNAELSTPQGAESSMINLPDPVAWLANYGGDVYTEAQLKQAVSDAQGVTELVEALSALVDCITETRGTRPDADLVKAQAHAVLFKYKGAKA